MKKVYAKSLKTYKKTSLLDLEKIVEAMRRFKDSPKNLRALPWMRQRLRS